MSLFQAFLIAFCGYLAAECTPWLIGDYGGYYVFSKPLVSGLVVGLILGDVKTGIMVGAAVQTVYLANMTIGGAISTDIAIVAYPAVALGIVAGGTSELAIAIATTLGILGVIVWNTMGIVNMFWNARAEKAAAKGNHKGIINNSVWGPQLTLFLLRVVPSFLVLYFGADFVAQIQTWAPDWLMNTLGVASGILPAVGIGILLVMLIHEPADWMYLVGGFMLVVYFNLGLIPISIIGVICAILTYRAAVAKKDSSKSDDMGVNF